MTSAWVKRGATSIRSRVRSSGGVFTSAMPQLPDRHGAVGGMLIDMLVTAQARIDIGTVERRLRREAVDRSEEHTSELQSLMRNSYAVFCLKKKKKVNESTTDHKQYY